MAARFRVVACALMTLVSGTIQSGRALANCNVIPAATSDFRSGIGSTNRPFASPDDVVEVRVRPAVCDATSSGYVDLDGDGSRSDDHVVTVLFTPPNGGTRNAVVMAESCAGINLAGCNTQLGGGMTTCVEVNGASIPLGLVVSTPSALQFRFPDTDARLDASNDDRTLAGPAKIVITRRNAPLACQLSTLRCADLGGNTLSNGVVACVDELYELDGTCRRNVEQHDRVFANFSALPPPTSLKRMIDAPGVTEVHITADTAGNLLLPLDYTDVLLRLAGRPFPLLARASTNLDAFAGGEVDKIAIPSGFAASYSPEGVSLPPVFSPLSDPSSASDSILFGSIDAPRGVLRVVRQACEVGSQQGLACTSSAQCGGDPCVGPHFEVRDRFLSGVGPVALGTGQYSALRDSPITLESVSQKQATGSFAFVVYEAMDGQDRNGDGDVADFVVTLRDAATGVLRPIGPGGSQGRAIVRVRDGEFVTPALESSGNLVAFLESEANQGNTDVSANGDVFDSVLRIFRLDATSASEVTSAPATADAALAFAGRIGAWIGTRFYFRSAEAREATQQTERASEAIGGGEPNAFSEATSFGVPPRGPATSADGRYVVFNSVASDLVIGDLAPRDCFLRDRDTDADDVFDEPGAVATEIVSVTSAGAPADGGSDECVISADGRYVAFVTTALNLDSGGTTVCLDGVPGRCDDVIVRDRIGGTTTRVSVTSSGGEPNSASNHPSISADGRFVAFESVASNLVSGDTNGAGDIFVRDRIAGVTARVSIATSGAEFVLSSKVPAISANGRFVAFHTTNPVLFQIEVLVHDRDADEDGSFDEPGAISTEVASLTFDDIPAAGAFSSISDDGRHVAFESQSALVPGDTNSQFDVFVRDRVAGTTERVSVASDGAQSSGETGGPFLSRDGRYVAFWSRSPDLVPGDTNVCAPLATVGGCMDSFVHDRVTGATRRISVSTVGAQGDDRSAAPTISPDDRFVVFESSATSLVPGDGVIQDVFVRGIDTADGAADLSGDGVIDDTVLRAADASGASVVLDSRCPAESAAVGGVYVAFLRPEAAGISAVPGCASADLNGDSDTDDRVVMVEDSSTAAVRNLHCAASRIALSATRLAALVSESDQGLAGNDWSGDGDVSDHVLAVRAPGASEPASCADWGPTTLAGVDLGVSGDFVALLSDESDDGIAGTALNGDGDALDRVLRLVAGTTGGLIPIVDAQSQSVSPQQAEDFVVGANFVAFRTRESANSNAPAPACSLNGDADCDDDVLQLYVYATGTLVNSGQAVLPCQLPECDPRKPYRVSNDTVRFLTFEADQGQDLNQDGDTADLLVQVFNTQARTATVVAEVASPAQLQGSTGTAPGTGSDPLASPSETVAASPSSQIAVALGRCVEDRLVTCSNSIACTTAGEFCFTEANATTGTCVRDTGASCYPDRPVSTSGCLAGATCARDFVVLAIADRDADQLPDAIDNCPGAANTNQADADDDGVGDACDLQTCGNATTQLDEQCDDGNLDEGDGCDSNCRLTICGNGIVTPGEACDDGGLLAGDGCSPGCVIEECSNGIDDDGAGDVDMADPGCANLADLSERNTAAACDDGTDNDADGWTDFPSDPGCRTAVWILENPMCQDGIENDADGLADHDGGQSIHGNCSGGACPPGVTDPDANGVANPDPHCVGKPYLNTESPSSCGLGFEVAIGMLVWWRLRRRALRARVSA